MMAGSTDLANSLDKHAAIGGVAVNAKAGAVLMTDQEEVIYLQDMRSWPDELLDQRVVVEGTLRRGQVYPEPQDEGGVSSQGISGEQWYLEVDRLEPQKGT